MGRFDPPVAAFDLEGPGPAFQRALQNAAILHRQGKLDEERRANRTEDQARLARLDERQEDLDFFNKATTAGVGRRADSVARAAGIFQDHGIGPADGGGPNALNQALSNRVTGGAPGIGRGEPTPLALPGQFVSEGAGGVPAYNGANPIFATIPEDGGIGLQRPQLREGFIDVGDDLAFDTNFRDNQANAEFAREQQERRQIAALEEEFAAAERGRFSEALGGLGDVLGPEGAQAAGALAGAGATPSTAVQIATRQSPADQEAVFARELELRRESEQAALGPELAARNQAALARERGVQEIRQEFPNATPSSPLARRHYERAVLASRAITGLDAGDRQFAANQGRDMELEIIRNFGFTTREDWQRALETGGTTISAVTPNANAQGSFQTGGGLAELQTSGQQLLADQFDPGDPVLRSRTEELRAQFPTMSAADLIERLRSEGFTLPGGR